MRVQASHVYLWRMSKAVNLRGFLPKRWCLVADEQSEGGDRLPDPWPLKKRLRQRRRDLLWSAQARLGSRRIARTTATPVDAPGFEQLAVVTIAMTPKYQDWCLSMIDSVRAAGGYAGPIHVVTEDPAPFAHLHNVFPIVVPATQHRLVIKGFKPRLARWVEARYLLFLDADVVVTQPLRQWYHEALNNLAATPMLAYPASNPVPGSYHGGIWLVERERAQPLLMKWLGKIRSGYHHSDQVCLKQVADPAMIGYFPDKDFTYLYRCFDPESGTAIAPPRRFVHVTNGIIRDCSRAALIDYLHDQLGLRRIPRAFGGTEPERQP